MYKICATKRDLDTIDRKLYQFNPDLWEVVMPTGTYQLKYEDTLYNLYLNGEKTTLFISNISLIRGCVYEGQEVIVNLPGNSLRILVGTLKRIAQDGEKAIRKSVVFSESLCSLKSPSQEYVDNRLVREEDIIRPDQVSVYFDPRYLSIEHVKTNGIEIPPMSFIPEYIERLPGDNMSSEVQKTQACKAVTCSKGDRVVVTKKEGVEYDIVITKVTDYSSLETILLNHDDVLEFDANQTVFIEFQIPLDIYTLYTHCGEIHTGPASVTVNSIIDGTTTMLLHGECNEFGDYSVTSTPILVLPQKEVKIEVKATCSDEIGAPLVYSPSIRNLITNLELSKTDISSNSETWVGTFTMPEADCLVSPKLKYIYHDGGQEDINPLFYLTVKSSDLASVVVNDTEYDLTNGPVTMPCDVADINWELLDGYISKVDTYSTDNPSTLFQLKVEFITQYNYALTSNTTIEISILQVDCKYKSFRGKVTSLDKGKKWNSSNSILGVSDSIPHKTYYVDTNVLIGDSGEPNHFEGTEVEEVVFYNPANSFRIHPKAFKKCEHLKSIDLSKASEIKVKDQAFWGSFSLSDFKNTLAISELGEYSFTNTDLPSFTYGSKLLQIPNYAFMNCRDLADVDYESTSPLESIGRLAFDNCRKLKHAVFPKSLSKIGDLCFGETAFESILTFPSYTLIGTTISSSLLFMVDDSYNNGLVEIPKYTFEFCDLMREAHLPKSIEFIDAGAFLDCKSLIGFESPGLWHVARNSFKNTILDDSKMTYLEFLNITGSYGLGFSFFANSEEIGKNVKALSSYILPNQNEDIRIFYRLLDRGYSADYVVGNLVGTINCISITPHACTGLNTVPSFTSVSFSPVLKEIGEYAFYKNKKLKLVRGGQIGSVQIVNDCTIQPYAFAECRKLQEVHTTDWNLKIIKNNAFLNCVDLIPLNFCIAGTEYIGDYAFDNTCRAAYDKFNALKIINGFALVAAAVAYTLMCEYAFTASMKSSGSTTPDTLEEVTTVVSEVNDIVADEYYLFLSGGLNIDGFSSGTFPDLQSALEFVDEYNAALETLKSLNPVHYSGSIADLLQADLSGFTSGTLFLTGNHDYIPAKILDTYQGVFSGPGCFVAYLPLSVYSYAGRVVRQVVKTTSKVVGKVASKAAGAGLATALAGISAASGFYSLMKAVDNLVWSFYDYPTELVLSLPNYYNAIVHGTGIWANRGVYDLMLPETLSFLGKGAFRNCKDLKSIVFLNSPLIIRASTFEGCEFLKNVKFCRNVQTDTDMMLDEDPSYYNISVIEEKAFFRCLLGVSTVNKLISNATRVGDYAFAWNIPMTLYRQFGLSIDEIPKYSQNYTVIIPPMLTHIGKYAFSGARLVKFESIHPELLDIDECAFCLFHPELGDYNPYLGASGLIFMVPEQCANEYKQRFAELGISERMIAYNTNLEIVGEV